MGMDVHGLEPKSEVGRYFRNNVWWWWPLAIYVSEVAPSFYNEKWQTNDGAGLSASRALALGALLKQEIEAGRTAQYAKERFLRIDAMPDVLCDLCNGTGKRNDTYTDFKTVTCNKCDGEGT